MAVNNEVLALILGGGQGTRLFPLTQHRSKPAVPIGGKYRLIDIPISNCLHADIRRIFVLTQFNSASLNRHIAQTYRMDLFSQGFVEILAAEQTPDNPNWFQGTADAVRQAARHFVALRRRLLPDSRRRSSLPDGLLRAGRRARRSPRRHHDRGAAGDDRRRVGDGHLPVRSQRPDRRVRGKAERASGSTRSARASRPARSFAGHIAGQAVRRLDGRLRVLARRAARRARDGRRRRTSAARSFPRRSAATACNAYLFRGYWADVGTVDVVLRREHHADAAPGAPFKFYDPHRPIYTHPRFLPGSRLSDCTVRDAIIAEGCYLDRCTDRGVGRRHPHARPDGRDDPPLGAARRRLLRSRRRRAGARRRAAARHRPRRRARPRHRRQERADRRRRAAGQRSRRPATPTATATTSATASSSCRRTA